MTDPQWKKAAKLVDTFYNRPDAEPFRVPVDWKGFGLLDYPKLIKKPMDLGTIRDNLKAKSYYKSLHQLNDDVSLVWANCMSYNRDGSDFHRLAESLQRKWDDKFSKLLHETSSVAEKGGTGAAGTAAKASSASAASAGPGQGAALKEKRDFTKLLFAVSKEDLGKILVEAEARCPESIVRNEAEDEVEFNVDRIPGPVLQELSKFAEAAAKGGRGGKKKSANAGSASGSTTKKAKAG